MTDKDLIFLIGAGCSKEANIPTSDEMVTKLEQALKNDDGWHQFNKFYCYLKNTILIGDNISESDTSFNIEKLVNVLSELKKDKKHILYPFFIGWNNILNEFVHNDNNLIDSFINKIIEKLPDWVIPDDEYKNAGYYARFLEFQNQWTYPLRIFSLNYDLCFEENTSSNHTLITGFEEDEIWNDELFIKQESPVHIYLYKLHGSIDWRRQTDKTLKKFSKKPGIGKSEIIFGTDYKVQSIDPYLFYIHELRKYSLECRLIIIIGYSFGDDHINNLIEQSLQHAEINKIPRKIIYVNPGNKENLSNLLKTKLKLRSDKMIEIEETGAKDFLEKKLNKDYIVKFLPEDEDDIFF